MSNKNIYEVFDDFRKAKTKQERIDVLRRNDTYSLRNILLGTFQKNIKFTVESIPAFRREPMPPGMSYNNMTGALNRAYLFTKDHPRTPTGLTDKRKIEILIQILESLEEKEADVFANMLMKDQKIPYLTEALVNEAFPGLL